MEVAARPQQAFIEGDSRAMEELYWHLLTVYLLGVLSGICFALCMSCCQGRNTVARNSGSTAISSTSLSFEAHGTMIHTGYPNVHVGEDTGTERCTTVRKIALFWLLLVVGEILEAETFVRLANPRVDHRWLWLLQDQSITLLVAGRRRGLSRCRSQSAQSAMVRLTSRRLTEFIFVFGPTSSKKGVKNHPMYS